MKREKFEAIFEGKLEEEDGNFQLDAVKERDGKVISAVVHYVASENYKYQDKELDEIKKILKNYFPEFNYNRVNDTIESLEDGDAMYETTLTKI